MLFQTSRAAVARLERFASSLNLAARARLVLVVSAAFLVSCQSNAGPTAAIDRVEIRLTQPRLFYPVHDTVHVYVVPVPQDGRAIPAGSMQWRSLDPAVATVDNLGFVMMVSPGTATIEVEVGEVTARLELLIQGILHDVHIASSPTWLAAESPHVVQGYLEVGGADTAVLTIEPGATVLFRPKSGLSFGLFQPGRLVIPAGALPTVIAGDSAARGSWVGLAFHGPGRSELRNVTIRHCGASNPAGYPVACIHATANIALLGPRFLVDGVTIREASQAGMNLENWVSFVPGSRDLTIEDVDGPVATVTPEAAGVFPLGGRFQGNNGNEIRIAVGVIEESTTWVNPGVPWKLVGEVFVGGPANPVLTLPPGIHVRAEPQAAFIVGKFGPGRLAVGGAAGAPVVLESTGHGWRGIEISDGAGPSSLSRVQMRDCGLVDGACVRVLGGVGVGTRLLVQDVTIRGSRSTGIQLSAEARFDPASTNLTITESADVPVEMPADAAGSLPPGDYRFNNQDVIRLGMSGVTRTATWRNRGVPYLAAAGLSIGSNDNPVLTLDPGVVVRMNAGTMVAVGAGALRAIGTASAPILFTSATPGVAGSWIGVELGTQTTGPTRLEYLEIHDAGAGELGWGGAVRMWVDPGGVLRNTTIRRSLNCGLFLLGGGQWVDDYTAPLLGNAFVDGGGPATCRLTP